MISHKLLGVLTVLLVFVLSIISCTGAVTFNSNSLKEIALSAELDKQLNPVNPTVKFTTDPSQIYCSFLPLKGSLGVSVSAQWIYVKGEVTEVNNYVIDNWTELVKTEGRMAMFMRRFANGWPRGTYKVILSVNDVEEIAIPFQMN